MTEKTKNQLLSSAYETRNLFSEKKGKVAKNLKDSEELIKILKERNYEPEQIKAIEERLALENGNTKELSKTINEILEDVISKINNIELSPQNKEKDDIKNVNLKEKYEKIIETLDTMIKQISEKIAELGAWIDEINETLNISREPVQVKKDEDKEIEIVNFPNVDI